MFEPKNFYGKGYALKWTVVYVDKNDAGGGKSSNYLLRLFA